MLIYIFVFVFGATVLGGLVYFYIYTERKEKEKRKAYFLAEKKREYESKLFWEQHEANKIEKKHKEEKFFNDQVLKYGSIFGFENYIECEVTGIFARTKSARDEASLLRKGDSVILKQEPTNSFDDYAVKVLVERKHIGYIPKELSEYIFKGIEGKGNYKAIVSSQDTYYDSYYDKDETYLKIRIYLNKLSSEK